MLRFLTLAVLTLGPFALAVWPLDLAQADALALTGLAIALAFTLAALAMAWPLYRPRPRGRYGRPLGR